MTNDELIEESERIQRDEYSVWSEFVNHNMGLLWTIERLILDKSESDDPLQLQEGILKGFALWKFEKNDKTLTEFIPLGYDPIEARRIALLLSSVKIVKGEIVYDYQES
tara:strand:- start:409 stop:735 length:327 start_codon:yes stop_codon:yes gene_type:complete